MFAFRRLPFFGPVHRRLVHDGMSWKPKDKDKLAKMILDSANSPTANMQAAKDTLLFRYEDPGKMMRYTALGLSMFPMWTYLAYFCYKLDKTLIPLKRRMSPEVREGWVVRNIERARITVAFGFFLFGCGLSGYWLSRSMNTVRRLVLRKGGKHVTIMTYGILGKTTRQVTVPVSHCSGVRQNYQNSQRFFMNVRNRKLRYQFNVEDGIFSNKPLFDRTVGLSRRL